MIPEEKIEDPQTEIEQLSDHLREYFGIRRELFELKVWDKLFGTASAAITWGIIAFLGIICVFMLSAAAAYGVGALVGKTWLGFLIVAAAYGLVAAILFVGRDAILQKPLTDRLIDHLVNDDDDDDEGENQEQKAA